MARPVFFITLGALVGAVIGMINGGGEFGRKIADGLVDGGMSAARMLQSRRTFRARRALDPSSRNSCSPPASARPAAMSRTPCATSWSSRSMTPPWRWSVACSTGRRSISAPRPGAGRWWTPWKSISGRATTRAAPRSAHALAGKIHWLDRAAGAGDPADNRDPFAFTWSGPDDKAVFDKLKSLVKQGYLDPGAFAFSGRAELREALQGVTPEASPCLAAAQN